MSELDAPPASHPVSERRSQPRFTSNLAVELLDSSDRALPAALEGRILNISRNGLKVRFWHDVPCGTQLSLNVMYHGHNSLCLGEVMWRREETMGFVYGIRIKNWTYLDQSLGYSLGALEHQASPLNQPPLELT